ncbi:unnamed protein product [Vitrella brassicaformis CCMP3155]|uniref:peptidyl-tRNA hydrolase n=1 Tax=Vitrella brassicaformis (strain CCMP3155) TaxID=1169540 RepID=A0A0G4ED02_VITBC|nr:unnamed protein product [Vitrella brassicaformis CCMP3155]|eukprot:CEL93222.1 unnamed protein product [Vitrella brassicaformis CCMP3155]
MAASFDYFHVVIASFGLILLLLMWRLAQRIFGGKQVAAPVAKKASKAAPAAADRSRQGRRKKNDDADDDEHECKLVLIVRNDLGMGKGKIGAQCGHATLGAYKKALRTNSPYLESWEDNGQPKICLKANDEEELDQLRTTANAKGGRTQIAEGSRTVLALGPGPAGLIDEVSGHLKLM